MEEFTCLKERKSEIMVNKKVHLICNAHIDPVWQWEWQEGISAAISTFQSAVDLSKEYDYIFCHNEVTLYKYIEEYAPLLLMKSENLFEKVNGALWEDGICNRTVLCHLEKAL